MTLKFDYWLTFKRCQKCGKGHDMSAISCSKPKGKDEARELVQCDGELITIQVKEFEIISQRNL